MRKKNFEILLSSGRKQKTKGFMAVIKTPGNLKFGVAELNGKWRTTELSTGWAIPNSFASTPEESTKKAQISIDKVNAEKTCLQGIVEGVRQCFEAFEIGKGE